MIYIKGGFMGKIAELIKYEGDNTTFVWKHPTEDFNSLTQLVVHESQEALFMMNGEALDLFGAGRYTLETQNIPKIGKIFHRIVGDTTPFHCEVYFINKTEQMAIKWGTDSRVQFMEPTYGFPLSIGASGEMSLSVSDSKKLLIKLVGTEDSLSQAGLTRYFRGILMTKVKSYIAQVIKADKINIFEIDERLEDLSTSLLAKLQLDFETYGLKLNNFYITNIAKPDGEPTYEKFKSLHFRQYSDVMDAKLRQQVSVIEAQTAAQETIIASQAMATKRAQEGYTYQQERGFDVAEQVAQNEATGQFTNLGVGLGTMAGIGGTMAGMVGGSMQDAMNGINAPQPSHNESVQCAKCGASLLPNTKFCPECGAMVEPKLPEGMVVCPHCGETVPSGKFCPECGQKLIKVCPNCGAEVGNSKFCPECGTKI